MASEIENVSAPSVLATPLPGISPSPLRKPRRAAEPSLNEIARILAGGRWTLAAVTSLALAAVAVYLLLARPVYRSTALMQVEEPPTIGAALERLSPLLEQKTSVEGYVEIMRSRMVLGPVVDEVGLDVLAEPRHLPVIGTAIARRHRGAPATPRLGLERFAWGGERISVTRLRVPAELVDRPLTLTALEGDTYRLQDESGRVLLDGRVGAPASAGDGEPLELLVSELTARPGTEFRIEKRSRDDVIDALQADLRIDEKAKDTGVIVIELDGHEPSRLASIVSSLTSVFLRENMERRSAEAAKTLEFLESQLPKLKGQMEKAETALIDYRTRRGTVDLSFEARTTVERVAELDKAVSDLESERVQLAKRYTGRHPDLVALERRLQAVRDERAALNPRVRSMPGTEIGAARLVRNAEVATGLYVLLSNQAETLRVAKAGMIGTVRLVDPPVVTRRPIRPRPVPLVALALIVGLGAGAALVIGRRTFDDGAGDPQDIEAATGLPVFATLPHSDRELHLDERHAARREVLALAAPDDPATEHFRTLRTALGFVLKARGNVVAVSSPSPGAGKTFVCANLAHLLAVTGKRVLLVDADLRRGALHRHFSAEQGPGLAEVLTGNVQLEGAAKATLTPGLDLLPRGDLSSTPGELLASSRLSDVLAEAGKRYDVVVVDTPPILAVADPLLIERCASVNLLVVRARRDRVRDIALAVERLAQSGIVVHGGILNDARLASDYGRMYSRVASGGKA
ncbi:polysaccharide biosynthesis tyrosine autokinase [Anaeromyxobacter sp. Fw109-5]|uniref:polysaccharide biosynthesis tyrosine autokinase n=1 Tax=Anaeromyxobacter sp. (strain Fw109-5) TaxID=404589 RepID=UPI0000ED74D1|nr:polysaccharide biosynthesis tyrosine autokinase [Anaeromyxobacter sp. Fw109-5]ABS26833.1 Non-specific protein-tyrosine kinase [Anaeromyxobacter sp. Fw109-5]